MDFVEALGWYVLSFLHESDTKSLRATSKFWCECVDSSRRKISVSNHMGDYSYLESLVAKHKRLEVINLATLRWVARPRIIKALEACYSLRELQGVHVRCGESARVLLRVVKGQRSVLEHLDLCVYDTHLLTVKSTFALILGTLPPVKKLTLHGYLSPGVDYTPLAEFLRRCGNQLRELSLTCVTRFECQFECRCNLHIVLNALRVYNHGIRRLVIDTPCLGRVLNKTQERLRLDSLVIRNCNVHQDRMHGFLGTALPSLKSLVLCDVKESDISQTLVTLLESSCCPHLERFAWTYGWRSMSDRNASSVLHKMSLSACSTSLQTLDLSGCLVDGDTFVRCTSMFSQLHTLLLSNVRIVSTDVEGVLCECFQKLTFLKTVDVSGLYMNNCLRLFSTLSRARFLECARLNRNNLSVVGLLEFLVCRQHTLVELCVENCLSGVVDTYYVLRNVPTLRNLKTLRIGGGFRVLRYSSNDELYLQSLGQGLSKVKGVVNLSLPATTLSGISQLVTLLSGCKHLRSVVLRVPVGQCTENTFVMITTQLKQGLGSCVGVDVW